MKTRFLTFALFLLVQVATATVLEVFVNVPSGDPNTALLQDGKVKAFGKEYDGLKVCNADTLNNPTLFEVFRSNLNSETLVILCPALEDGDENTISILRKNAPALTRKVRAESGSYRVSNLTLQKIARDMLKAGK